MLFLWAHLPQGFGYIFEYYLLISYSFSTFYPDISLETFCSGDFGMADFDSMTNFEVYN